MEDKSLPTVLQTSSLDPVGRQSPHSRLDILRKRCPVLPDGRGGYFLTRYDHVRAIASDTTMWRDPHKAPRDAQQLRLIREPAPEQSLDGGSPPCSIVFLDDPDHARIRAPLARALYNRVKGMRPRIEAIVNCKLDQLDGLELFDAVSEFALPIPIQVIAEVIGVDPDRMLEFRSLAESLLLFMSPVRSADERLRLVNAQNETHRHFLALLAARRREPKDDLVSDLVALQRAGAPISDHEIQANLRVLLTAGNLTTTDMIGNAIWLLLSHPEQLAQLRSGDVTVAAVIEETLRMEPPIDVTFRIASRDVEIGDQGVATGQVLTLSLRAANRDPDIFPWPHQFDPKRSAKPHLTFGGGAHICLGAALARLEMQVAIEGLFRRLPNITLANPSAPPEWRALAPFRGLKELQVRVSV